MGLMRWVFGERGVVRDLSDALVTGAEVFRPNAERSEQREADIKAAVMAQYAAEFHRRANRTWIDALADGLNRLVRPVLTLLVFLPLALTYSDPARMARVWGALSTLPEYYWYIVGLIIAFYFGGRMQVKSLEGVQSQFEVAAAAARQLPRSREPSSAPVMEELEEIELPSGPVVNDPSDPEANPALDLMLQRGAR